MKKKILLILGILTAFLGITAVNALSVSSNSDMEHLKRNENMLKLAAKVEQKLLENGGKYPAYYGGMYMSDDATNLVLQVVEKNIPTESSSSILNYSEVVNMDKAIKIEYVNNTYTELQDIYEKINKYYEDVNYEVAKANFKNYSAHYIDIKSNSIIVNLYDYSEKGANANSEEKVRLLASEFKEKVIDSEIIKYEKGNILVNEATTIKAGQGISVPGGTCSMGYRVKINGFSGYITAAHCFSGTGQFSTGGVVTRFQEGGKVDAAFIQTTSAYSPSNALQYTGDGITKLNNTMCPILMVGTTVAHAGVTSGYKKGPIQSLNYSGNFDGIAFTNLITVNYTSAGGDSGGSVFVPSSNGEGLVAGIHKGSVNSTTKVFVDAGNIYLAFNYSRY